MAKYLVTGGAGFIGSTIVERLVERGYEVRVVDNLSTGKLENIQGLMGKIEFLCGDLADFRVAERAVDGVEYILHQAALPSVPLSVSDPVAVNRSIVTTTVNLFKAAADGKTVKRIVQAVSAAAYGDSPQLPKREDMDPDPLSPYAAAKLAQEYYGRAFCNVYGLEILSLRYFNVFGPKQDPKSFYAGVIPIFISRMLQNKRPTIFGDGLASRDFIYIDNVVEANLAACTCQWPGRAETVNIGSGRSISLNGLVDKLNGILGTKLSPVYAEAKAGDVRHSVADIAKARELLGYEVKVDFDEGLARLVEWFKGREAEKAEGLRKLRG
ncbi:MAG: SDR family oxidoreductase [Clostridiales bacterium]|jgi:UDP-glucose 4-epimerase|nr:SDR family oxidoreductase [Eubacteriales bacterium]MDH7565707.1 SDR family oxidoreductase [Clostridiales bacterium]